MYREDIIKDLREFISNSGVDPDSYMYKKALWALRCLECNNIWEDE